MVQESQRNMNLKSDCNFFLTIGMPKIKRISRDILLLAYLPQGKVTVFSSASSSSFPSPASSGLVSMTTTSPRTILHLMKTEQRKKTERKNGENDDNALLAKCLLLTHLPPAGFVLYLHILKLTF